MLNDNTKDYTNSIVKVVPELTSSASSQVSGSTATQGAVVPLRRYHRHHYRASTESQAPKNRSSTTAALYRLSGSAAGLRAVVPLMRYHETGSTTIVRTFAPKIFRGFGDQDAAKDQKNCSGSTAHLQAVVPLKRYQERYHERYYRQCGSVSVQQQIGRAHV